MIDSFENAPELIRVEDLHKSFGGETSTTATVVIQGAFENGAATITVKLANDGPAMKVVHIHVHAPGPLVVRERA